jgi:hypothetical protein
VGLEDSPDGGRSDTMVETDEFAVDPAISGASDLTVG